MDLSGDNLTWLLNELRNSRDVIAGHLLDVDTWDLNPESREKIWTRNQDLCGKLELENAANDVFLFHFLNDWRYGPGPFDPASLSELLTRGPFKLFRLQFFKTALQFDIGLSEHYDNLFPGRLRNNKKSGLEDSVLCELQGFHVFFRTFEESKIIVRNTAESEWIEAYATERRNLLAKHQVPSIQEILVNHAISFHERACIAVVFGDSPDDLALVLKEEKASAVVRPEQDAFIFELLINFRGKNADFLDWFTVLMDHIDSRDTAKDALFSSSELELDFSHCRLSTVIAVLERFKRGGFVGRPSIIKYSNMDEVFEHCVKTVGCCEKLHSIPELVQCVQKTVLGHLEKLLLRCETVSAVERLIELSDLNLEALQYKMETLLLRNPLYRVHSLAPALLFWKSKAPPQVFEASCPQDWKDALGSIDGSLCY